jgi:hypothetical protein
MIWMGGPPIVLPSFSGVSLYIPLAWVEREWWSIDKEACKSSDGFLGSQYLVCYIKASQISDYNIRNSTYLNKCPASQQGWGNSGRELGKSPDGFWLRGCLLLNKKSGECPA